MFSRNDQRAADALYAAAARHSGEKKATLNTIVELPVAGRRKSLIAAVASTLSDDVVRTWFNSLVRDAVVGAGGARWRMSWSGPGELVTPDGEVFDEETFAADLAVAATARDAAARLTGLGVDLLAVRPTSTEPGVEAGDVVAGISDMKSGDTSYDVLVLEKGLVLAEVPNMPELPGFRVSMRWSVAAPWRRWSPGTGSCPSNPSRLRRFGTGLASRRRSSSATARRCD